MLTLYHKQQSIPASLRPLALLGSSRAPASPMSAEGNKQNKVSITKIIKKLEVCRLSNGHDIPEDLLIESHFMGDFSWKNEK